MRSVYLFIIFQIICISISFAQTSYSAKIIEQGVFDCFPARTKNPDGKKTSCETSAVVYYNNNLYFASDKKIPNHSSVFHFPYSQPVNSNELKFIDLEPLKNATKYEDFTITPDKKFVFLTTGFDRVDTTIQKVNNYNTILYWLVGKEQNVSILSPTTDDKGVVRSVILRDKISKALRDPISKAPMPYFKIEGLAAIPDNKLIFGVRAIGKNYEDYEYTIKFLSIDYFIQNETITFGDTMKLVYEFKPLNHKDLITPLGLSSLEYDNANRRFYLTTSYEFEDKKKDAIGAYLWILPYEDFVNNKPPHLVYNEDNKPLHFKHKVEGVTIIDNKTIFLICDDDRYKFSGKNGTFKKSHNQAAYYVVKMQ